MRSVLASLPMILLVTCCAGNQPIDFDTQVMPILTRQGCNAGSCHGAAIGRGDFKLSLLGSDAAADHDAIVRQLRGRRVNLAHPGDSLVLLKPSEQVEHEGGLRLDDDSASYELLQRWIAEGALRQGERKLAGLDVQPTEVTLPQPGQTFSVRVTAHFNDGNKSDVTALTVLTADDPESTPIDPQLGLVTVTRRGVHTLIARYLDRVVPIRAVVPITDLKPTELQKTRPANNEIDRLVNQQLDQLRLPASPPADPGVLLRRLSLDLTGRLPTLQQHQQFQQSGDVDQVIDQLLGSDAYARYWALKWASVVALDAKQLQPEGAKAYHDWLADQIRQDRPVTEMAFAMLTTVGDSYELGPANFLRTGSSPGDLAEHASQVLMGVRLRCANCHNHPLDHWTQDDYHGLAAVFAKVKRGRVVTIAERGEVTHPVTRQAAIPRIPGTRDLAAGVDGRGEFAAWLTDKENPYLARVTVNRVWQQLMGRGLAEPVDDLRDTNPPSNPRLLQWLADDFAAGGFRMKRTIQAICRSRAYQRSSQPLPGNASDNRFFSRALIRPLEAEVIADAIGDVTGIALKHGEQKNVRAVDLTNNRTPSAALDVLGRCDRAIDCAAGESAASLARTLHLINGPLLNDRVRSPDGRLAKLLQRETDNEKVLGTLYQLALGRPPANRLYWQQKFESESLEEPQRRAEFFQDLFWSLLTSQAFITNQ